MSERRLSVFQRVRDAAVRGDGIQMTADEVATLFGEVAEIGQKAFAADRAPFRDEFEPDEDEASDEDA